MEMAEFDNDADLHIQTGHIIFVEPEPPASFESSIVDGNALHAASVLVAQAAFQSPNICGHPSSSQTSCCFISRETCDGYFSSSFFPNYLLFAVSCTDK
jgi:hypothetical protein